MDDVSSFRNISAIPQDSQKYDVIIIEKAYLKITPSASSDLRILNVLTARSGLKGMKYYSISDSTTSKLILESFSVRSCDDRSFIADKRTDVIQPGSESFFLIKDNRLGTICFNGTVVFQNGNFYETDASCGSVSRMGMKVFNNGGYVIKHYLMKDESGGGYFYCSVQLMKVESSIMKKLDLLKPENFANRVRGETVHFFGRMGYDVSSKIRVF